MGAASTPFSVSPSRSFSLQTRTAQRWTGIVKVVQCALPIDPDQPDITAVTRPLHSVNSKNGGDCHLVGSRNPSLEGRGSRLYNEMVAPPFKTVMHILTGSERLQPCPICQGKDSQLTALDSDRSLLRLVRKSKARTAI